MKHYSKKERGTFLFLIGWATIQPLLFFFSLGAALIHPEMSWIYVFGLFLAGWIALILGIILLYQYEKEQRGKQHESGNRDKEDNCGSVVISSDGSMRVQAGKTQGPGEVQRTSSKVPESACRPGGACELDP